MARFLIGSLQVWSQSSLWPNLGLVQRAGLGSAQIGDTDALPPWLRREKVNAHGLADELPRRLIARDADPDRRLSDFRELSRNADCAGIYGGFFSGSSPVEMS